MIGCPSRRHSRRRNSSSEFELRTGPNTAFYVDPLYDYCEGTSLKQNEECWFSVQWIIPDTSKQIFNDMLVVSGETDPEQGIVPLHLKGCGNRP